MSTSPEIVGASSEHLDLLTGLAAGFRDHLGGSTPSIADLATSIHSLIAGGDAEFLIAVAEDGAGAGFIQMRYRYSMWLSAHEAHLEDLFVVPSYRRRRLGTRLAEQALERAERRGCASVAVDTMNVTCRQSASIVDWVSPTPLVAGMVDSSLGSGSVCVGRPGVDSRVAADGIRA